ncbi:hypothetical protein AAFF39_05255 [Lactococcus garvieae]
MNLNKKQIIIGGLVSAVLIGSGAGLVHRHNVRVEKDKQIQQAKEKSKLLKMQSK